MFGSGLACMTSLVLRDKRDWLSSKIEIVHAAILRLFRLCKIVIREHASQRPKFSTPSHLIDAFAHLDSKILMQRGREWLK